MKGRKGMVKRGLCFVALLIVLTGVSWKGYAASECKMLQSYQSEDHIILYLTGLSEGQQATVQIGTESVGTVTLQALDDMSPIVTWLLVDNSLSISKADRETTEKLINDIVAGKSSQEVITLCTISDHLHILAKESGDYIALKTQAESIVYENQETYLTDVLDELLDEEATRQEMAYVRCIVISDGVDNNPGGITRDELMQRLSKENIPIYTFGCSGESDALKAMYALSRQTGAKSWAMSDISDSLVIADTLSREELPLRVEIPIPDAVKDGTAKGIRLTFEDGIKIETQMTMPFGTSDKEEPKPTLPETPSQDVVVNEPQSSDKEDRTLVILILCGGVIFLGGGVLVFFMIRRNLEKKRVKPVSEQLSNNVSAFAEQTEFLNQHGGDTMILVGSDRTYMLSLTDMEHPERSFELPLQGKVTIGRNSGNQIVVDYDRSVSGSHCEITVSGDAIKLHDLHSRNGTFLDGVQVVDTVELANGSTLRVGRVSFKVSVR